MFNFVPLVESVKGLTTQGAAVIIACLLAACYLARLRLIFSREERAWWSSNSAEIVQARAATTATLPKPTKAPPSPVVPLTMLAVFLGCALMPQPGPSPSISPAHRVKPAESDLWFFSAQASPRGEVARAATTEPSKPGPVHKDCDPKSCRPPSHCERGECVNSARKPVPTKLAGQASSPSSYAVRAAWQDTCPEPMLERQSDAQWLAQQL